MVRKSKGSFKGKTRANAARRKQGRGFAYLSIPSGVEMFVPEADAKYLFDILPYEVTDKNHPDKDEKEDIATVGSLWYKRPFKIHKSVGANNEKVICPRSVGKRCPICDLQDDMRKNDGDEDEIKALYPSNRNLYAVVPIGSKKYDEKVYLFDFSDYLFQERFEEQLGDKDEFEIFPDHLEGVSIRVRFAESSFGKIKYAEPTRFDFEEREQQYNDEFLDDVPKLDECFHVLDYDELKAKFYEIETEEEEEKEEEKPAPRRRKKVVEKEQEEEVKEEAKVEEEKPRKRTTRRSEQKEKESVKKCPHGHTFGKDNDEFDDCDNCDLWNVCYKETAK